MAPPGNLQGNLLARAEAVVARAFRVAAEHQATLAQARNAVQPLRDAAVRQSGGVPHAPDADRPRKDRPA
ncbi:hypothetical protein [Methylobacterium sp. SyP6R]|uniref:hypothetical protein n=1 Tax=Methylobacterium sp. SyP6R TaxID=2718876 RepID=UPI001F4724AB|nr:hypothetical protein [Methylobacterium sp. SyP6R]MCF4127447.1 hypothetical protein [Methylobacterium sp. SyP6R]